MTQIQDKAIFSLVDVKQGLQGHQLHHDQKIFDLEMERIFARSWLFLTHECAIPNHGDYVTARMGLDEVIVIRQKDGSIKAFLNVCRHRGARVCPMEAGNTRGFVCNYHGWSYGLDGSLQSVPFEDAVYKGRLAKDTHGLHEVARIESYHGFVYGCFDPAVPDFKEYLGDFAWYLDIWMKESGGMELVGPPARCFIHANWKVPSENFVGDAYHVGWTHTSALRTGQSVFAPLAGNTQLPPEGAGLQVTTKHGHGLGVLFDAYAGVNGAELVDEMMAWGMRKHAQLEKNLGEKRARLYKSHLNGTVFPNNSFLTGSGVFKVWQPHSIDKTEVFTWAMVEKDMPADLKDKISKSVQRTFGIAGYWESEDNDNMESETHMARGTQSARLSLNAQMGLGGDNRDPDYPGVIGESAIGETSYRGFYRFYKDLMLSDNWEDINEHGKNWVNELLTTPQAK